MERDIIKLKEGDIIFCKRTIENMAMLKIDKVVDGVAYAGKQKFCQEYERGGYIKPYAANMVITTITYLPYSKRVHEMYKFGQLVAEAQRINFMQLSSQKISQILEIVKS